MTSRKGVRFFTYVLQLYWNQIIIVKTSIFTINAINLEITCGHPANKAKNLTMTYLYPIQNCFWLFLNYQPPPPPKKRPTIYQFFCQVNFQMLKLAFPVSTSSSLSPLSTFTHQSFYYCPISELQRSFTPD